MSFPVWHCQNHGGKLGETPFYGFLWDKLRLGW
jgi:hypothetical protein